MNRTKAMKILDKAERPAIRMQSGNVLLFARQTAEDIEEIEKLTSRQIEESWRGLFWMNYIYGQVSINEVQRISLLELEMETRPEYFTKEKEVEMTEWIEKARKEHEMNTKEEIEKVERSIR